MTSAPSLHQRIQRFYDISSGVWERTWGEHMHHGYYGPDGTARPDRRQAQIDLINELLTFAQIPTTQHSTLNTQHSTLNTQHSTLNILPTETLHCKNSLSTLLDVGCGIGGSSLYLAEKLGAIATGITLSPVQAQRATERAQAAQINAQFQVADALAMPFEDHQFDLVWALESGEHMPDKTTFLQECHRVLKPGGTLIMATWCHRPVGPPTLDQEQPLSTKEQNLLESIYRIYHLPYVISLPEYEAIAQSLHFKNIRTADWSAAVAPFWNDVIRSAFSWTAITGVLQAGPEIIQGAFAMRLMHQGYQQGLIRFGVLTATKMEPQ